MGLKLDKAFNACKGKTKEGHGGHQETYLQGMRIYKGGATGHNTKNLHPRTNHNIQILTIAWCTTDGIINPIQSALHTEILKIFHNF